MVINNVGLNLIDLPWNDGRRWEDKMNELCVLHLRYSNIIVYSHKTFYRGIYSIIPSDSVKWYWNIFRPEMIYRQTFSWYTFQLNLNNAIFFVVVVGNVLCGCPWWKKKSLDKAGISNLLGENERPYLFTIKFLAIAF